MHRMQELWTGTAVGGLRCKINTMSEQCQRRMTISRRCAKDVLTSSIVSGGAKANVIRERGYPMKNNSHKKLFKIDEFARRYYCQHARLNQLRSDKRSAKRRARREFKKENE